MSIWLVFDAVGLGVFSILGASIAYHVVGLNFLPMLFGGMITAIGGGSLAFSQAGTTTESGVVATSDTTPTLSAVCVDKHNKGTSVTCTKEDF